MSLCLSWNGTAQSFFLCSFGIVCHRASVSSGSRREAAAMLILGKPTGGRCYLQLTLSYRTDGHTLLASSSTRPAASPAQDRSPQPASKFFQLLKIFSQVCVLLSGKVHQLFAGHLEHRRRLRAGVQRVRLALTSHCASDPTLLPYSSAFFIMALFMDLAPSTSKSTLHNLFSAQVAEKLIPYVTHCGLTF